MYKGLKILALACMLTPVAAEGRYYTYNKVVTTHKGNDGFGFDKVSCMNVSGGKIELKDSLLLIDSKPYILKPKRKKGIYRSEGCRFELVFGANRLRIIKKTKLNSTSYYYITNKRDL